MYILFKYLIELIFFLFLAVLHFYWHSYILCDFLLVLFLYNPHSIAAHILLGLLIIYATLTMTKISFPMCSYAFFVTCLVFFFFLNLYIYNILLSLFLVKKKTMLVFIFHLCSAIANKDALSRQASYMHASWWFFFYQKNYSTMVQSLWF